MNMPAPAGALKLEHSPLLDAGIKYMSMDMLHHLAVEPFTGSARRPMLYANLDAWISRAMHLGLKGEIWIDGSFTTQKTEPDDIDCVLIIDEFPANPTEAVVQSVDIHLDRHLNRASYSLDLYPLVRSDESAQKVQIPYWRGWFGFCRDGITAKGIARIEI